jgi:hypothetical protein
MEGELVMEGELSVHTTKKRFALVPLVHTLSTITNIKKKMTS